MQLSCLTSVTSTLSWSPLVISTLSYLNLTSYFYSLLPSLTSFYLHTLQSQYNKTQSLLCFSPTLLALPHTLFSLRYTLLSYSFML